MIALVREKTTNVRLKGIEFVAVLCNILDFHAVRGRGGRWGGAGRGREGAGRGGEVICQFYHSHTDLTLTLSSSIFVFFLSEINSK
jgi:hypothetical protein